MSDETPHPTLRPDYWLAEGVRMQTEVFAQKFRELEEGGLLAKTLRTPTTLQGARLEQAPEVFTEQYLVEPVLHGLGYLNPASEEYEGEGPHFIRQPITYKKSRAAAARLSAEKRRVISCVYCRSESRKPRADERRKTRRDG